MSELLPCERCGSENVLVHALSATLPIAAHASGIGVVVCECGHTVPFLRIYDWHEDGKAAWNRRAFLKPRAEENSGAETMDTAERMIQAASESVAVAGRAPIAQSGERERFEDYMRSRGYNSLGHFDGQHYIADTAQSHWRTWQARAAAPIADEGRDAARYRWLRDVKCNSVTVSHDGDHAANYMPAADWIKLQADWFSDCDPATVEAMKAANTIWEVQIYPNTPIGFNVYFGATLDQAIDAAIAAERGETPHG